MAKSSLSLQEAFQLLEVPKTATIDEVKQAYRKRAFALHPDLHPDNKNAAHEFQRVNEAYVTVISYLDAQAKKNSAKAQFMQKDGQTKSRPDFAEERRREEQKRKEERERREKERQERIERERKEMERRQAKERAKREEERRRRLQEEIERQEAKMKAKQEEERLNLIKKLEEKAQEFKTLIIEQMEQARKEREQKEKSFQEKETRQNPQANTYNASGRPVYNRHVGNVEQTVFTQNSQQTEQSAGSTEKENTSDNTAYTHIKSEKIRPEQEKNQKERFTERGISVNKENSISQALIKAGAEPFEGIKKGISSWFKSQIDEELELFFPASKLQPGVKMRLQFRVGLGNELQTIELTLPKDFVPGKPLRLKGMGKKIGKWQGDLYLKLQSK